jgi:hypothetical protein
VLWAFVLWVVLLWVFGVVAIVRSFVRSPSRR